MIRLAFEYKLFYLLLQNIHFNLFYFSSFDCSASCSFYDCILPLPVFSLLNKLFMHCHLACAIFYMQTPLSMPTYFVYKFGITFEKVVEFAERLLIH